MLGGLKGSTPKHQQSGQKINMFIVNSSMHG
jgi:hypothetical protein